MTHDRKELNCGPDNSAPEWDGYCKHGVYVGGMGIDWMCGLCEAGDDE